MPTDASSDDDEVVIEPAAAPRRAVRRRGRPHDRASGGRRGVRGPQRIARESIARDPAEPDLAGPAPRRRLGSGASAGDRRGGSGDGDGVHGEARDWLGGEAFALGGCGMKGSGQARAEMPRMECGCAGRWGLREGRRIRSG